MEDYDFFYLIDDSAYLNAKRLRETLDHISISFDIYMGSKVHPEDGHCEISGGIIFSNSMLKKIKQKLDTCAKKSLENQVNENILNCVRMSSDVKECQTSWQGISVSSFKLNSYKIYRDLHFLKDEENFNKATSVYPVHSASDFYMLHAYFSRLHLEQIQKKMSQLENESRQISNGTISNEILEVKWPLGVPESSSYQSRHDILLWTNFNLTHSFMSEPDTNVKELSKIDAEDIRKILDRILIDTQKKYPSLTFKKLNSGYRSFDSVRGMDYKLHLTFQDDDKNEILKVFEVVKPISLIEIIPSPYVTESTTINIILPVFESHLDYAEDFIERYEKVCLEVQENTVLLMVFLYKANSPNKGESDAFYRLKNLAQSLTSKYKGEHSKIYWLSIRLPEEFSEEHNENDLMVNTMYGKNEILSLAISDLALRKFSLDNLIMVISNTVTFKTEFLNRVR